MAAESETSDSDERPLVLAAINDEALWETLAGPLEERFRVRRETSGLRAIDVALLLHPMGVIAESGLPDLSGILLARLIGHNRYLTKLPVALILSRDYLIEEFWAKDSGAVVIVPRKNAIDAVSSLKAAIAKSEPVTEEEWNSAEKNIQAHGSPAAGVANELERQLIGASILARLGEIEVTSEPTTGEQRSTIPSFIHQALDALASVLEFAQAGVALFESSELFIVRNEVFKEELDEEAFIRETRSSASLYSETDGESRELEAIDLPPVRHELPGPRGPASTFFALPLTGSKGVYGLLSMMTYKEIAVREYYLQTLSLIGSQLSVALERALFYEEVRRLSVTDALTGLSNRRAIIARLDEEFRRSIRYRIPLSVAVCDLDDFKMLNDKYGHLAGDAVLKAVAAILRRSVREVDLAGRWGGEEMALLFPQTDNRGAMMACERIREQIADHRVEFQGIEMGTTLSIGVATMDPDSVCPRSAEAMIGLADRAMYLAKQRGKNQVASFLELQPAHAAM